MSGMETVVLRRQSCGRAKEVANLTVRSAEANAALVRGDLDTYLALIEHANDYTPTRGRFFANSARGRADPSPDFQPG
jgi:hypothetical protein